MAHATVTNILLNEQANNVNNFEKKNVSSNTVVLAAFIIKNDTYWKQKWMKEIRHGLATCEMTTGLCIQV